MVRAGFDEGDKMRRFGRNLDNPQAALKQIGALMVAESQRAFKTQRFGKKEWEPRAPINIYGIIADFHAGKKKPPARRFESRPALIDTGGLLKSLAFSVVSSRTVEVGVSAEYRKIASTLHGGGKIESKPITQTVRDALGEWLLKVTDDSIFEALGFLLEKKMLGKTLKGEVQARPFVGITKQTIADIKEVVGVTIMEVK